MKMGEKGKLDTVLVAAESLVAVLPILLTPALAGDRESAAVIVSEKGSFLVNTVSLFLVLGAVGGALICVGLWFLLPSWVLSKNQFRILACLYFGFFLLSSGLMYFNQGENFAFLILFVGAPSLWLFPDVARAVEHRRGLKKGIEE